MLIFMSIILFWVTNRIGLHTLMLRNHISFLCPVYTVFPFCLKRSVLAPVPLRRPLPKTRSALIGQLTQDPGPLTTTEQLAVLTSFLCGTLAARHKLCKCATCWHSMMSLSHRIKGRTTDEAFQVQCFLWERVAHVGADFALVLTSQIFYLHENQHNILTKREKMKHNGFPLN